MKEAIEIWVEDGRIVLSGDNHPLRAIQELPLTCSSEFEGFEIEALQRLDCRISKHDIHARMPHAVTARSRGCKPNAISMRAQRFRERNGLLTWVPRKGTSEKNAFKESLYTEQNLNINSRRGLQIELTKEDIVQMREDNKGNFGHLRGEEINVAKKFKKAQMGGGTAKSGKAPSVPAENTRELRKRARPEMNGETDDPRAAKRSRGNLKPPNEEDLSAFFETQYPTEHCLGGLPAQNVTESNQRINTHSKICRNGTQRVSDEASPVFEDIARPYWVGTAIEPIVISPNAYDRHQGHASIPRPDRNQMIGATNMPQYLASDNSGLYTQYDRHLAPSLNGRRKTIPLQEATDADLNSASAAKRKTQSIGSCLYGRGVRAPTLQAINHVQSTGGPCGESPSYASSSRSSNGSHQNVQTGVDCRSWQASVNQAAYYDSGKTSSGSTDDKQTSHESMGGSDTRVVGDIFRGSACEVLETHAAIDDPTLFPLTWLGEESYLAREIYDLEQAGIGVTGDTFVGTRPAAGNPNGGFTGEVCDDNLDAEGETDDELVGSNGARDEAAAATGSLGGVAISTEERIPAAPVSESPTLSQAASSTAPENPEQIHNDAQGDVHYTYDSNQGVEATQLDQHAFGDTEIVDGEEGGNALDAAFREFINDNTDWTLETMSALDNNYVFQAEN